MAPPGRVPLLLKKNSKGFSSVRRKGSAPNVNRVVPKPKAAVPKTVVPAVTNSPQQKRKAPQITKEKHVTFSEEPIPVVVRKQAKTSHDESKQYRSKIPVVSSKSIVPVNRTISVTPQGTKITLPSGATTTTTTKNAMIPSNDAKNIPRRKTAPTMRDLALSVPRGVPEVNKNESLEEAAGMTDTEMNVASSAATEFQAITPSVQIVDGKMVVSHEAVSATSTVLNATEDDGTGKRGNNGRSSEKKKQAWSQEEIRHFYNCLRQVGTDFSLMTCLFPSKTRKELKTRFKREERLHPTVVELALNRTKAIEQDVFDTMLDSINNNSSRT